MSEYQYYHFLAIDVPLDEDQREELRELSSRAEITANSFINEYNWGDFRGRPEELMERYFDAFLYVANWGSRRLMFRLPREQLAAKTIGQYLYTDVASVSETAEHVIISLSVEPYDSLDDWTEPDGQLAAMVPVRSDLAAGDLRLAYLGWLLAIDWDEIDEEDVEPPVPAGLDRLNGPLRAIADFLSIDKDLLAEAATASPALSKAGDQADISGWIAGLPDAEKNALLARVAAGEGGYVQASMQRGFRASQPRTEASPGRRTVGELLDAAESRRTARESAEAERERQQAEQEKAARAAAYAKRLDGLADRDDELWQRVDGLIEAKNVSSYDTAVALLVDLRALADRNHRQEEFGARVRALRVLYSRRTGLLDRLAKAGLS
jgi:hypothetical protein